MVIHKELKIRKPHFNSNTEEQLSLFMYLVVQWDKIITAQHISAIRIKNRKKGNLRKTTEFVFTE